MKLVGGITRFFYTMVLILLGGSLILVALNLIPQEKILGMISLIYLMPNLRFITG